MIRKCLATLPPELFFVYDRAWQRVTGDRISHDTEFAKLILMWVSLAEQPLTIRALREALSTSTLRIPCDALLSEQDIVSCCAGLIRTEPSSETNCSEANAVFLLHPSLHRYFHRNQVQYFGHAHDAILAACTTFHGSDGTNLALSNPPSMFLG
jgi:hypothetical protein